MNKAPVIGISRLRMGTDGHGVTTLVAFHGCPLRCQYCLNPHCNETEGVWKQMTAEEIYDELKKDSLYFKATNGGVTFGGGEPMLRSDIIRKVLELGADKWHNTIETSLNVESNHNLELMGYIDHYIIDVKDMNPEIYERYTGHSIDNMMMNLRVLQSKGYADNITFRLPLIEGYNTDADRDCSEETLHRMGFTDIQRFTYVTDVQAFKTRKQNQYNKTIYPQTIQ